MKRAIIVHCWSGYPNYCWYSFVKSELELAGFSVEVPEFPNTDAPREDAWVPFLREVVGHPDDQLFLIGHSIGCATIMRYLETLGAHEQIGGAVFVAGFTNDLGFPELSNFFKTPINFPLVRSKLKNGLIAIHSDNDPYVPLEFSEILNRELGAEIIIKSGMGHFSGPREEIGSCVELPVVVEAVNELSQ